MEIRFAGTLDVAHYMSRGDRSHPLHSWNQPREELAAVVLAFLKRAIEQQLRSSEERFPGCLCVKKGFITALKDPSTPGWRGMEQDVRISVSFEQRLTLDENDQIIRRTFDQEQFLAAARTRVESALHAAGPLLTLGKRQIEFSFDLLTPEEWYELPPAEGPGFHVVEIR